LKKIVAVLNAVPLAPAAAADLDNINAYLRTRHPQYRETTIRRLYEAHCR